MGPRLLISIHAPREGSDIDTEGGTKRLDVFLSTLPARGATGPWWTRAGSRRKFLSTLPARGATGGGPDRRPA